MFKSMFNTNADKQYGVAPWYMDPNRAGQPTADAARTAAGKKSTAADLKMWQSALQNTLDPLGDVLPGMEGPNKIATDNVTRIMGGMTGSGSPAAPTAPTAPATPTAPTAPTDPLAGPDVADPLSTSIRAGEKMLKETRRPTIDSGRGADWGNAGQPQPQVGREVNPLTRQVHTKGDGPQIPEVIARFYLQQANGDKDVARQLAREAGFSF
jgi:hypothetical protein